jgi:hypothetical protein
MRYAKRPRGRPKLQDKREKAISVRFNSIEYDTLVKYAEKKGMKPIDYIRFWATIESIIDSLKIDKNDTIKMIGILKTRKRLKNYEAIKNQIIEIEKSIQTLKECMNYEIDITEKDGIESGVISYNSPY